MGSVRNFARTTGGLAQRSWMLCEGVIAPEFPLSFVRIPGILNAPVTMLLKGKRNVPDTQFSSR